MKELYELHKGKKHPKGVICGYNLRNNALIVEDKKSVHRWKFKDDSDVIFSDKTYFSYLNTDEL